MNTRTTTKARLGILLAAAALALTACSSSPVEGEPETTVTAGDSVSISDGWVKAADAGMSAAFGEIANDSDQDLTIVSASTEASTMVELHETVENDSGEMAMRPIDGGFVIPAGGTLSLAPGANHIMLMDLVDPVQAGDEVTFTLTFSDDSTFEFTVPAKDYSGANENYEGGDSGMDMGEDSGMDMGTEE